jgi:hypothetical protein
MFFHNMPYQYKFAEKTQDMLYYSMPCSSNKSFFFLFLVMVVILNAWKDKILKGK